MNQFQDDQLNQTLSMFLKDIQPILREQLVSVYLYGSALHQDLCPGYGDLDFLVVVNDNLASNKIDSLNELRSMYRSSNNLYAGMLEGAFLPLQLIQGEEGQALCWGTRGESIWSNNQLDVFTMYAIKHEGVLLHGASHNDVMPEISVAQIRQFLREYALCMRQYGKAGRLHSIDWLLLGAKFIGWLKEGTIMSKSQAADWGIANIQRDWKEHLHKAKELRQNPSRLNLPVYAEWLNSLEPVIIEASHDLDAHLDENESE